MNKMSSEDVIRWFNIVSRGIAESKRMKKPRIQDWDKRRRPLRYKWGKSPPFGTEPHMEYDKP